MAYEVKCWCQHCKKELPPSHTGPCPHCGKTGKDCKVTLRDKIGIAASLIAQKTHKYTKKHPLLTAISIALTIISPIVGYLLDNALVGLLIGIILAILNLWLTPYVKETIVEITRLGNQEKETQEAKAENNTSQRKTIRIEDIHQKLEDIEKEIGSSRRIQKIAFFYALGVAFIILGLSYLPLFLEHAGVATTMFYRINISGLIAVGTFALVYASLSSKKKKEKGGKTVGTKGRRNVKKPKQTKEQKEAKKKK